MDANRRGSLVGRSTIAFPSLPGVYLFKDEKGKVIYVGKAKSLKSRVSSYFRTPIESPKTQALLQAYNNIEYIVTASELEALLLENKLIKQYQPKYNVQWRDDKSYPYIKLTINEEWPRIFIVRKKDPDGALYFGPYDNRGGNETLKLIKRLFSIRSCKETPMRMRKQPCLQYHIKRCWGPCISGITNEQYRNFVRAAAELLLGDLSSSIDSLRQEMKIAAKEQRFEQAAKLRNQIFGLEKMMRAKKGWMPQRKAVRADKTLSELRDVLGLSVPPNRIEAFDVSNISGTETVASMVVYEDQDLKRSDYRKFIIRTVLGANDVASIHEAVLRRYTKTLKSKLPLPDLILIDGGITQVNAANTALDRAKLKIPVIGLAKREERIYRPKKKETIKLPDDSSALHLLQRIRDEAHRFAISFHRQRRGKKSLKS